MALGLCKQTELDDAVRKAAAKKSHEGELMTDEERRRLVSTEQSLAMEPGTKLPSGISGLETFTLGTGRADAGKEELDADSLFNLPADGHDEDEEDEVGTDTRRRR